MHLEDAFKGAAVLHQKAARLVGLKEPLVRVQPDRIGALDSAQNLFTLLSQDREAPVGGVDMHPGAFRLAEVCHRFERIDGSGAGCPGVGAHRDGIEPRSTVRAHGASQRLHVQPSAPVARNHANALRSDADDHRPRLSTLWLWSLMYTVARSEWPAASRAATRALRLAAAPPLVNSPPALSG